MLYWPSVRAEELTSDTGDIDLVMKKSFDQGRTWSKMRVIADHGPNTIGNPCPVVDQTTGAIWLLLTANPGNLTEKQIINGEGQGTRTVWLTKSLNEGTSWSSLEEITPFVKDQDWTWYATGPRKRASSSDVADWIEYLVAIRANLLVPSIMLTSSTATTGKTWKKGGSTSGGTDESQVVELRNGTLC